VAVESFNVLARDNWCGPDGPLVQEILRGFPVFLDINRELR